MSQSKTMNLQRWVEHIKADHPGKLPKVHYDDFDESYWLGLKLNQNGFTAELPLARGMMKSTAEFFRDKVAELFAK